MVISISRALEANMPVPEAGRSVLGDDRESGLGRDDSGSRRPDLAGRSDQNSGRLRSEIKCRVSAWFLHELVAETGRWNEAR